MLAFLAATALLAASHTPSQVESDRLPPFRTEMLDYDWKLLTRREGCSLTHPDAQGRLAIMIDERHTDKVAAVSIYLWQPTDYTHPVQLAITAFSAGQGHPAGRLTFQANHLPRATMLVTSWPAQNLRARLANADHIEFRDSAGRLAANIVLTGVVPALTAFNSCMASSG